MSNTRSSCSLLSVVLGALCLARPRCLRPIPSAGGGGQGGATGADHRGGGAAPSCSRSNRARRHLRPPSSSCAIATPPSGAAPSRASSPKASSVPITCGARDGQSASRSPRASSTPLHGPTHRGRCTRADGAARRGQPYTLALADAASWGRSRPRLRLLLCSANLPPAGQDASASFGVWCGESPSEVGARPASNPEGLEAGSRSGSSGVDARCVSFRGHAVPIPAGTRLMPPPAFEGAPDVSLDPRPFTLDLPPTTVVPLACRRGRDRDRPRVRHGRRRSRRCRALPRRCSGR